MTALLASVERNKILTYLSNKRRQTGKSAAVDRNMKTGRHINEIIMRTIAAHWENCGLIKRYLA